MKKILIGVVVLVLLGGGAYVTLLRGVPTETATQAPPAAPLAAEDKLVAEARVVPAKHATLSLPSGGIVTAVLAQEGDWIKTGQVLLRLDPARAEATVAQAQAQLAQAQAAYERLSAGATSEEIAATEAQLRAAQAQLRQTQGSVTPADRAAAQAQLAEAQARLTELRAGPKRTDLQATEAQLAQTQASLTTQRDRLSAAKTNAQLQMQQAVNDLTKAQSLYATAKQNWQYVQETGKDPNAVLDPKTGKKVHMKLDDRQKQQYYDAYVQAEAAMHNAEVAVQQGQVAYDTARQTEASGVQAAEQQVANVQANLDKVRAGAEPDELASANAQVASAQAGIEKLRGEQRSGALDAAQATVEQAGAELDGLRAGASKNDLAVAAAEVQSAQAVLQLAKVALDQTELRAPFDGVVALLDLKIGEYVAPGAPVLQLADVSAWRVETTDLTELNIVHVREGSPAVVTFDALPGLELLGKVSRIRALGENKQGDITYVVTITPDRHEASLRWNMTAAVSIAAK